MPNIQDKTLKKGSNDTYNAKVTLKNTFEADWCRRKHKKQDETYFKSQIRESYPRTPEGV